MGNILRLFHNDHDRFVRRPESGASSDGIDWENLPEKRKIKNIRMPLLIVSIITTLTIVIYGAVENKETTYKEFTDRWYIVELCISFSNKGKGTNNETDIFYTKEEVVAYPVFLKICSGLLGIILGVLLDRFSLVLEERDQLERRYNNSHQKLIKSCFSGISWKIIAVVFVLVAMGLIPLFRIGTPLKAADYIYVVGGIGVVPFFVQLLNLNRPSEVVVSRIIEKEQMYPGYILAWSYYLNTLKNELEYFNKLLRARQHYKLKKLSCDKLILLLAPGTDIANIDDLISYDETIEKIEMETGIGKTRIPIYKLQNAKPGENYNVAMLCVRGPLVTLRNLKKEEKVIFVTETTYEDELKRFYKTLSEILEDAPDDECTEKALLVPVNIKIGHYTELKHGVLVRIIMKEINKLSETEV